MPIHISATGISEPNAHLDSVEHAARAGLSCLDRAGLSVEEVDFLANVGVYRHHNLCEPAVCALVQHAMGMCLDARAYPVKKHLFSFDLNNGGCGVLSAVHVLNAMLTARKLDHALIVGSDCPPSGAPDPHFPITPMGGSILLSRSDEPGRGFHPIRLRTSERPLDGQVGSCDISRHGLKSRTTIDVVRDPEFLDQLLAFACQVVNEYLSERQASRNDLKLVCSQPSSDFGERLADGLGLPSTALSKTFEDFGDVHTTSMSLGYHLASQHDHLTDATVLFVEVGSGLTVGCALYE